MAERNVDPILKKKWDNGVTLRGYSSLKESFIAEVAEYMKINSDDVEEICNTAKIRYAKTWKNQNNKNKNSINNFYNDNVDYLHSLASIGDLYRRLVPCMNVLHYMQKRCGESILDYGSGNGTMALFFTSQNFKLTLSDISFPMLDFALWRFKKRNWKVNHINLRINSLPENAFDNIICFDVFEHLQNPWDHLKTLQKALKKGGYLFIVAPFGYDPCDPTHIIKDSRIFDLAPILGFIRINYRKELNTNDRSLYIFKSGQSWGFSRLSALCGGVFRYFLRFLKNGKMFIE